MKEMDAKPLLILTRQYKPEATLGTITINQRFLCKTLERPKFYEGLENLRDDAKTAINESCCIPEGEYLVKWTFSPELTRKRKIKHLMQKLPFDEKKDAVYTFEVIGVKDRSGIRFHAANIVGQLLGCIAPCLTIIDMSDGKKHEIEPELRYFAKKSAIALKILEDSIIDKKIGFKLRITSI